MAKVIEVVYENGVFKPLENVDLREGEIVEIEIKEKRIGDRFYRVLEELERKAPKVHNAFKVLEEVRNDRY
ncbi:antitoxin AF2212-like protein [Geoglobus acetivorans]|uniref:Antitoxin n=1 Tax=Geoglobus acetivorans TaxID=565033 RepID=A0ABZ3H5A1_GEOAI|nr:antitoxin family protein [Geoglobus acetivorans]